MNAGNLLMQGTIKEVLKEVIKPVPIHNAMAQQLTDQSGKYLQTNKSPNRTSNFMIVGDVTNGQCQINLHNAAGQSKQNQSQRFQGKQRPMDTKSNIQIVNKISKTVKKLLPIRKMSY